METVLIDSNSFFVGTSPPTLPRIARGHRPYSERLRARCYEHKGEIQDMYKHGRQFVPSSYRRHIYCRQIWT